MTAEFIGPHTKAMVLDRHWVFTGSMNPDPRYWAINSEMGVVIDSPPRAEKLSGEIDQDMEPKNARQVRLEADGQLRRVAGDDVH